MIKDSVISHAQFMVKTFIALNHQASKNLTTLLKTLWTPLAISEQNTSSLEWETI